jgi:hypothetical protein
LLAAIAEGIDEAMWMAIRALEEGGMLMARMAEHVHGHDATESRRLASRADDVRSRADTIRKLVTEHAPLAGKS